MDTRGYGRSGRRSPPASAGVTGALMLAGLCGICVGVYAVLDHTAPRMLALPMLAVGVLVAVAGPGQRRPAGRAAPATARTRGGWPELVVAASGVVDRHRRLVGRRRTSS